MRRITFAYLLCLSLLAACASGTTLPSPTPLPPTPTVSATAIPTATASPTARPPATATITATLPPTATPPPTPTLTPTDTPTPAPTPMLWRIWFQGTPCIGADPGNCAIEFSQKRIHSILSDGSEFQQAPVSALPPAPIIPADASVAPGLFFFGPPPQASPDASKVVYIGEDDGLYLYDYVSKQTVLLLQPNSINAQAERTTVRMVCWLPDQSALRVIIQSRVGIERSIPSLYRVELDGQLTQLMSLDQMGATDYKSGDCSPDGQEAVLPKSGTAVDTGLYVVNLNTGDVRQILGEYYADNARKAPSRFQP